MLISRNCVHRGSFKLSHLVHHEGVFPIFKPDQFHGLVDIFQEVALVATLEQLASHGWAHTYTIVLAMEAKEAGRSTKLRGNGRNVSEKYLYQLRLRLNAFAGYAKGLIGGVTAEAVNKFVHGMKDASGRTKNNYLQAINVLFEYARKQGYVTRDFDVMDQVEMAAEAGEGVVKVMLTRGAGARGYAPPHDQSMTRIVVPAPLPAYAQADAPDAITARWCSLRLARQPRLAGIKHLNRLENVLARAEWSDPAIFEGLLCDDLGAVIGGVMSNLLIMKQGELFTPDLAECGVAGVARTRLLRAAPRLGIATHIGRLPPAAILAADEVMICNSVIGVRRVARLDDVMWPPAGWATALNNALYEDLD